MRVFVTGASGWVGSSVVDELQQAGHHVTGLARSDASAAALAARGVAVHRGELDDLDSIRAAAEPADAVIHLAFKHDFTDYAGAGRTERAVVEMFGDALAGTGATFMLASGLAGAGLGRPLTERDASPHVGPDALRGGSEALAMTFVDRDIRPVALRFAPTVHGAGDHGFVAQLARVARERGVAGYVGDGTTRWAAVHRLDNARMVRLALEKADAGSVVHGVAEEGVPSRAIAEAIGRGLGVPVTSVAPEDAVEHFGWIGRFFSLDVAATSDLTRAQLGWEPTGPTLLQDLAAGHYVGA
ncbi:oxidoreductase [Cellulomonas chitinilytica]|uniref:Oxidoreductase n=1 Tax=Cellulomonas chitinilytica TaxID=398759 RepID=A0A919P326_9CELL|nr:SDR family oxidoreductase [Cellulomonas chitinilytica]GIG21345.1 oxidoreductase [Cellulomonas chitinilytica]